MNQHHKWFDWLNLDMLVSLFHVNFTQTIICPKLEFSHSSNCLPKAYLHDISRDLSLSCLIKYILLNTSLSIWANSVHINLIKYLYKHKADSSAKPKHSVHRFWILSQVTRRLHHIKNSVHALKINWYHSNSVCNLGNRLYCHFLLN